MAGAILETLLGMNLRDSAPQILPGETQESVGCDFSVPGVIKPMREGLLTWTLAANIVDAHVVYLNQVRYLFTTHADGLRVTTGAVTTLIDSAFRSTFKILPVNDEYVVMSDGTYQRKWKPGWATTYEWGLNTPPDPVVAVGTPQSKAIAPFETVGHYNFTVSGITLVPVAGDTYTDSAMTVWTMVTVTCTGTAPTIAGTIKCVGLIAPAAPGNLTRVTGAGDAVIAYSATTSVSNWSATGSTIAPDLTLFKDGSQSMKMNITLGNVGIAQKTLNMDLSYFSTPGDAGEYLTLLLSFFAQDLINVKSIVIKFSCSAGGGYADDFYQMIVNINGNSTVQLVEAGSGMISATDTMIETTEVDPYILTGDVVPGETETQKQYDLQTILAGVTPAASMSWANLNILQTDFLRVGSTVGRDWSTITGVRIEVTPMNANAEVNFDNCSLGGGNLFGSYWVAVAYQDELGNYGPYSNFIGPVTVAAQPLNITGLTVDSDPQTTKRRLAILGGSLTQPMVAYLNNNAATSMTYDDPASVLVEVESYFNNRKPPACVDMVSWAGRIFMVMGDNTVRFSEPLLYEGFPYQNQLTLTEGEQLRQIAVMGSYVAARGKDREHLIQLAGETPAYWQTILGAKQGAVSSRLLLIDISGGQVYASKLGFYISDTYYLPKINPVVADFSAVFGAMIGDRAYLAFTDTDGMARVMRIDYRLGAPVAHYVGNFAPTAIFADQIEGKVYYALSALIYEFDAGTDPLPARLVIPEQLCGSPGLKDFYALDYSLTGGPLVLTLTLDGAAVTPNLSLPNATRRSSPLSLPLGTTGTQLGFTLVSTTEDFVITCPLELEQVGI
ncbi:MAG: hypothetical protein WC749_02150 [Dehalococcoidia bacterium]